MPRSTQKTSYGITNGNRPIKKKRDSLKSRSCWCFFFSIHHNALPFFLEDFCFSCYESNRKGKNCGRSRNSAIKNSNSTENTHWLLSFDTNRSIIDYWQGTIQKFPLVIKTNQSPSSITTFWVSSGNFGFRNFFMNRVKAEFNWDKKFNCNLLIKRKTFWEVTCTKSTDLWSWILCSLTRPNPSVSSWNSWSMVFNPFEKKIPFCTLHKPPICIPQQRCRHNSVRSTMIHSRFSSPSVNSP